MPTTADSVCVLHWAIPRRRRGFYEVGVDRPRERDTTRRRRRRARNGSEARPPVLLGAWWRSECTGHGAEILDW
jgi:hypothetical protein